MHRQTNTKFPFSPPTYIDVDVNLFEFPFTIQEDEELRLPKISISYF